jgi:bifunctional UDP-N-acetylglucosamine pyrophosphorylase/glucosamine-1-phosphate N-acetyltransferase
LRTLIIPAAGRGSRLESDIPKVLYPVAGRPMLDRLLDLYADVAGRFVLVLSPEFEARVREHCAANTLLSARIDYAIQERPDGMLPAILAAAPAIAAQPPGSVWITWCDQVAIRPGTIRRLIELTGTGADLVLPTVRKPDPYIHFDRGADGRITAVRHRREGDVMPETGESDSGLFALSARAWSEHLPCFAVEPAHGAATGERNFLPFIPWMARRGTVLTLDVEDEVESLGVNTPADARSVEAYFARHA